MKDLKFTCECCANKEITVDLDTLKGVNDLRQWIRQHNSKGSYACVDHTAPAVVEDKEKIIYVPKQIKLSKSTDYNTLGVVNNYNQEVYWHLNSKVWAVNHFSKNHNTGKNFKLVKAEKLEVGKLYLSELDQKNDLGAYELIVSTLNALYWAEDKLENTNNNYQHKEDYYEIVYCSD